eukprot:m.123631 g.123631  ORF g.123631 m.123631 type:complete len:212 (-) comp13469_c0_seq1:52-687(-)
MPSEQVVVGVKALVYFVIFVVSSVAVGELGQCKTELEKSQCTNWNDGYTPCPFSVSFEASAGPCDTSGESSPCNWIFTIGSLSAVLGFTGFVFHALYFADKQPDVSHVNTLELCVAALMTLFVMSAAAVATDKFKTVCDSISDSPTCGTDCEAKLGCIGDAVEGYSGFYMRLVATQDSLWVATCLWLGLGGFCGYLMSRSVSGSKEGAYRV